MKQRPKTGFKQKNMDEINKASYDDIEKYADLLYEEKYEDKIKGARNIISLLRIPKNLISIPIDNTNIFDILSRTLRDEHKKNMELCIILLSFFTSYSYFPEFHSLIISQSIGEICMNIADYQFMKYEYRRNEMIRFSTSDAISKGEYQGHLDKFLFLVRKQDRILKLAFLCLLHLTESLKIEYKMVKKDIVGCIMKNLGRQNIELLLVLVLFLKKLSMFAVNKDAMIKNGILEKCMDFFKIGHPVLWKINVELLFNLSFDRRFRMKFLEKPEYFNEISDLFGNPNFRSIILRFLYNISLEEKSMPYFFKSDCLFIIYELIHKFPEKNISAELAALTLNLITYPLNAKKIASKGRVKNLIERALKNSDFLLIKIVKNILKYSDNSKTNNENDDALDDLSVINEIYEDFIDEHFMKILKGEGNEFFIEVIEILSYIDTDWNERIQTHNLIHFFEKELKENRYDERLIAVISFLGNVASHSDCSDSIANSSIISLLYSTFQKKSDNYDIVFGIIYILYQLLAFDQTRQKIINNTNLINSVISCLKCNNQQIIFISTNFLEVVQLFDNKWKNTIKCQKFELIDSEANRFLKMELESKKIIRNGDNYYEDVDDDMGDYEGNFDNDEGYPYGYKYS